MASRLRPLVSAAIGRRTRAEWLAELDLEKIPVSPVLHFDEALNDPQLATRRPEGATPVVPLPLSEVREARPPRLGEHTSALLGGGHARRSRTGHPPRKGPA